MSKVTFTVKIFIKTRQYFQISCVFIFKRNLKKRFLINPFMGWGRGWREREGAVTEALLFFSLSSIYIFSGVCSKNEFELFW